MPDSAPLKQTKKQKKAAQFRARNKGKGKAVSTEEEEHHNDVPVSENQDELEDMDHIPESQEEGWPSKKRKRAESEGKEDEDIITRDDTPDERAKPKKKSKKDSPQRFILFVGNLKYTTSLESIKAHFAACDPPPTVRLLTPKVSSSSTKTVSKSKGCAFLEFTNKTALQQALKLHQSEIDGRRINVELTAGGGGKGEGRLNKVRERNKGLDDQRKKHVEKMVENGKKVPLVPSRPQRYSATSGADQAPTTKKTWTVGDVEDEVTHRGGEKHKKRGQKKKTPRAFGTGANAVAVG